MTRRDAWGPVRSLTLSPTEHWGHNWSLLGDDQQPFGYLTLVPRRVLRFAWGGHGLGVATNIPSSHPVHRSARLLSLLNVRYLLAFAPNPGWWTSRLPEGMAQVRAAPRAILFENPDYLPRCFFVSDAVYVPGEEEAFHAIVDEPFDARGAVLLEGSPPASPRDDAHEPPVFVPCTVTGYAEQRVALRVDAPRPGWIVLLDRYDPGWSATVDGRPAAIRRADYLFRAVAVDAGSSSIEMRYSDTALVRGSWIALATLVLAVGIAARRPR